MAAAPRAAIFDVDGTLVDSVDLHARAWQEAFAHFGKHLRLADVRHEIGKGGDQLIPVFLSAYELSRYGDALDRYRAELWRRDYAPRVRPFPLAAELVLRAREAGIRVALASSASADEVESNRRLLGLEPSLLDGAVSGDDAARSKPSPDIFEAALAATGAPPDRGLAIGDSPWDALSARRAGLRTIGMRSGGFPEEELRDAGCVAIYDDPVDLLARWEGSPLAGGA